MSKVIDIAGRRFGRLTVTALLGRVPLSTGSQKRTLWRCLCDCGKETRVDGGALKAGTISSCGCGREDWLRSGTHQLTKSGVYHCWSMMLRRCNNPQDKDFTRYGGRGITVCDRWMDVAVFAADMGPRPKGYTLDRVDNDKGYSPDNCRWADRHTQANNTSTNRLLQLNGLTLSVSQWAVRLGVKRETLFGRLRRGLAVAEVLNPTVKPRNRNP